MHCPILVSQIASKYKHAIYLVFWPIFGLMFHFCENLFHPEKWHIIHCTLDDMIPFCEVRHPICALVCVTGIWACIYVFHRPKGISQFNGLSIYYLWHLVNHVSDVSVCAASPTFCFSTHKHCDKASWAVLQHRHQYQCLPVFARSRFYGNVYSATADKALLIQMVSHSPDWTVFVDLLLNGICEATFYSGCYCRIYSVLYWIPCGL